MTKRRRGDDGKFFFSLYSAEGLVGGVVANESGLVEVFFPRQAEDGVVVAAIASHYQVCGESTLTRQAAALLEKYFSGEPVEMTLPVDFTWCSDFYREVLKVVMAIPYGKVMSYGEVALRAGHPHAARGVGTAMAKNLLPIIIPCHRVVGAGGNLGGYSADGGIETKKRLLVKEGALKIKNL